MANRVITLGLSMVIGSTLFFGFATDNGQGLKENDTIVSLGDSITQLGTKSGGYVTLVSKAIAAAHPDLDIEVLGAGVSGNKVADCQQRLERDVLQKEPTIVIIYIGINDVWHWTHPKVVKRGGVGTTREDFESGLKDIINKINRIGARVILCTPTVIGEKTDGTNLEDSMLDEFAEISRKVANDTGSTLLDLRAAFIEYLKEHNRKNVPNGILTVDMVHLNKTGNRFLAGLVLESLKVQHDF